MSEQSPAAKMVAFSSLLGSAKATPLPLHQVEEELRRHFGEGFRQAQKPLDFLCWVLADSTLRQNPPQRRADLRFRLRRFPNFTLLPNTSNFEIQLAAICSRAPHWSPHTANTRHTWSPVPHSWRSGST